MPAWTGTVSGAAITLTGNAINDNLTLSVVAGNLQHNIAGGGFASNQDFDNTVGGIQSVAAAALTSLTINGGGGTNAVTFGGSVAHTYDVATAIDIQNANLTISQPLTASNSKLTASGAGEFSQAAVAAISLGGEFSFVGTGFVTFRNALNAASVSVSTSATSVNSIVGSLTAAKLNATSGDIGLIITSAAGGINFDNGSLTASGNVTLTSGTGIVNVINVDAGGGFSSKGNGAFSAQSGATIKAGGAIVIDHVGNLTFRGSIQGSSITANSDSVSASAILGNVAGTSLTATGGDISLTVNSAAGGIPVSAATLTASGDISLTSGSNSTTVLLLEAGGGINAKGTGAFTITSVGAISADGAIVIDHGGVVTLKNKVEGGSISVSSGSTSASAILSHMDGSHLNATAGNISLTNTAAAGGIAFATGKLTATGDIVLTGGTNSVGLMSANAGGAFSSTGAGQFSTAVGSSVTAVGSVSVDHQGLVFFQGPVVGESITLKSASTSASALRTLGVDATLTSTAGDVILEAAGGVTLQGNVTVNGATPPAVPVDLTWGAVTDLPNGVLGFDRLFTAHGAPSTIAINGPEVLYENPGGAGFDVGMRLIAANPAQTGNTGSFGGAVTAVPLTGSYVYLTPWSGSNFTFYVEFNFYETGTSNPIDVVGFETEFEDVERGRDTREWLVGPRYETADGSVFDMDFTTGWTFTDPPDGGLFWMVNHVEPVTVAGEPVYRAVPWYPVEGGTQLNKNVLLDLSTTPLSYFRIGTSKNSNGGSFLMSGLGTLQTAVSVGTAALFSSTGTAFNSKSITTGSTGVIQLNHSGVKSIGGVLDAGTYDITGTGNVSVGAVGGINFYVNVQSPPLSPLWNQIGGNLSFILGSTVSIIASGNPAAAADGIYTLADINGGVVSGAPLLVTSGSGAAAIAGLLVGLPGIDLISVEIESI